MSEEMSDVKVVETAEVPANAEGTGDVAQESSSLPALPADNVVGSDPEVKGEIMHVSEKVARGFLLRLGAKRAPKMPVKKLADWLNELPKRMDVLSQPKDPDDKKLLGQIFKARKEGTEIAIKEEDHANGQENGKATPAGKKAGRKSSKQAPEGTKSVKEGDTPSETKKTRPRAKNGKAKAIRGKDPTPVTVGTVLKRNYKGQEVSVRSTDKGFLYSGTYYHSLTAVAKVVTGYKSINGCAFFGANKKN